MKSLFHSIAIFFSTLTMTAQNFDVQKIDSLFTVIEEHDRGMGSISFFKNGKEIYRRSYGYADIENSIKANANTKYRIGSISKTFTSTVIMKLIEDGKLTLSTPLSNYYPQIKNAEKITIQHLLQHRSGISNFTSTDDYMLWSVKKHTGEQLIDRIVSGGVTFEPEEKFEYSNSNYVLLTFIAEDASGQTFSDLLETIIIKPCGLKNTHIGGKIKPNENEALSYIKVTDWKKFPETDMSVPQGAGFIVSTPSDLNVFLGNLFNHKILKEESLKQMMTLKDYFGLGLMVAPFYEKMFYGHTGGVDGFQSRAFYLPDENFSVSILENGVVYPINDIMIGVLSIYYGREYRLPQFTEAIVLDEKKLDTYLGVYSTANLPLKITVSKNGNSLIAQATGQSPFPLEYFGDNKFRFETAGIELEFLPETDRMILKQSGMTFEMTKEQ